jgi:sodium-dependent phosphate cotransporter
MRRIEANNYIPYYLFVFAAIYMVMGANVGTAITCMLVALAHLGDGQELERATAGASILYIFNLLTAIILFPLEVGTEYLYRLTKAMLPSSVGEGEKWEGPVKQIVSPLGRKIIIANKDLIDDIATGDVEGCSEVYPVECLTEGNTYDACPSEATGLIGCDEDTNKCPAFFQNGATKKDDMVSGYVCLVIALFILICCLLGLVTLLRHLLLGASTRIIYKATSINQYVAIMIGCGVTVLVQSSSITSSSLVPLCGVGVLSLEQVSRAMEI